MAYLTIVSRTSSSATLRVDGLVASSTYLEVSIWINGYGSSSNLRTLPTRSNGQSNEWTVSGLSGGTTYYPQWSIRTASNSNSGSGSFTTLAPPSPPSTPTGFYASNTGIGTSALYWNASSGASYYNVSVYNSSGSYHTGGSPSGTGFSFSVSPGSNYYAYVSATNNNGTSSTAYTQWQATSPPVPSPVSVVYIDTSSNVYGRIIVSFPYASNANDYYLTIRQNNSYGTIVAQGYYSPNINYNFDLTPGNYYVAGVTTYNSYGSSSTTWSIQKQASQAPLPSPVSYVTATPHKDIYGRITVYFPSAANASQYYVTIRQGSTSGTIVSQNYYAPATNHAFGLLQNTSYYVGVTTYNSIGQASSTVWSSEAKTTQEPKPSDITGVSVSTSTSSPPSVTVTWNAASYVVNYGVELYRSDGTYTGYRVDISSTATRQYTFSTGLSEYTNYYVKVYGKNNVGNGNATNSSSIRTGDFTDPSISITGITGLGKIELSWSASDSGSGLASTNRFLTYIGSRNGGQASLSSTGYTMTNSASWTSDSGGTSLIAESVYWVGVRAYDAAGRSTVVSSSVTFKLTRPTNWDWATVKSKNAEFSLTANEWNGFTARINQFRLYKGLTQYSFTSAEKGKTILHTQINEAIIAIRAMATELTHQTSGGEATASFINSLKNTLNSIT